MSDPSCTLLRARAYSTTRLTPSGDVMQPLAPPQWARKMRVSPKGPCPQGHPLRDECTPAQLCAMCFRESGRVAERCTMATKKSQRKLTIAGALTVLAVGTVLLVTAQNADAVHIMVFKTPSCGCCTKWIDHTCGGRNPSPLPTTDTELALVYRSS